MKIEFTLSEEGIRYAINELLAVKQDLEWGLEATLELLAKDGADIAQIADGSMATVIGYLVNETTAKIQDTGEKNLIAEFGAGDATLLPSALFEEQPVTDVYPGSYSEQVGTGEYAKTGRWHFGGREYTQVEARMGLYKALEYIIQNAGSIAQGVIKL